MTKSTETYFERKTKVYEKLCYEWLPIFRIAHNAEVDYYIAQTILEELVVEGKAEKTLTIKRTTTVSKYRKAADMPKQYPPEPIRNPTINEIEVVA